MKCIYSDQEKVFRGGVNVGRIISESPSVVITDVVMPLLRPCKRQTSIAFIKIGTLSLNLKFCLHCSYIVNISLASYKCRSLFSIIWSASYHHESQEYFTVGKPCVHPPYQSMQNALSFSSKVFTFSMICFSGIALGIKNRTTFHAILKIFPCTLSVFLRFLISLAITNISFLLRLFLIALVWYFW